MKYSVVLVGTQHSRNIGFAARAMVNMGSNELILVNPQCEIDVEAYHGASCGQRVLDNLLVFNNWEKYHKFFPNSLAIALSARQGKNRKSKELGSTIEHLKVDSVHLVFGSESSGLTASDIGHCHETCFLPTYGGESSLNLSQAVLLALFICQSKSDLRTNKSNPEKKVVNPGNEELRQWLETMGFRLDNPKTNAMTVLHTMLQRAHPGEKEWGVFKKALLQSVRKMKDN